MADATGEVHTYTTVPRGASDESRPSHPQVENNKCWVIQSIVNDGCAESPLSVIFQTVHLTIDSVIGRIQYLLDDISASIADDSIPDVMNDINYFTHERLTNLDSNNDEESELIIYDYYKINKTCVTTTNIYI